MKMHTYLNFAGQCAKAFRFYEKHLGGTLGMMMTHGQAPKMEQGRPEMKDAVLHARISLADTELMGADIPSAQPMRSAYLSLGVDSDAEAAHLFGSFRRRRGIHADAGDVLRQQIRPVARSVRHQLDDHPPAADDCARVDTRDGARVIPNESARSASILHNARARWPRRVGPLSTEERATFGADYFRALPGKCASSFSFSLQ